MKKKTKATIKKLVNGLFMALGMVYFVILFSRAMLWLVIYFKCG